MNRPLNLDSYTSPLRASNSSMRHYIAATAAYPLTKMILAFWDVSKCGTDDNWNAGAGWSVVTQDDARLAMSSAPIFGVDDLQGYWRNRDQPRPATSNRYDAAPRAPVLIARQFHPSRK